MKATTLVIACGAIANEIVTLMRTNGWQHLKLKCLPPELHNTPARIPDAVTELIEAHRDDYEQVFVAYADCGTGGRLDKVLAPYGIERLAGAHCYEFLAGSQKFAALADEEPGTFFLTDFLVRHFERLVVRGLGLDRHPALKGEYFGNYRRVVYLSQAPSEALRRLASSHAEYLGLEYEEHHTGFSPFASALSAPAEQVVQWRN